MKIKIDEIAQSIITGLDRLNNTTNVMTKISPRYDQMRREIILEHLRHLTAVEADAESPHLFKYCGVIEHPDGANYCYKCGGALRTA